MTYMSGLIVRASDTNRLVADLESFGREAFQEAGATNLWVTQNVMAGEGAGEIGIACDWETVDAAVRAPDDMRAEPRFVEAMQAAGIQTLRRSLLNIITERGTLDGEFGSMIVSAGAPADQATMDASADAIWGHIEKGANGIRWGQGIAAGALTGMYITISTTDSLDDLVAASNEMFADPQILTMMGEQGFQLIQRAMFRRLA